MERHIEGNGLIDEDSTSKVLLENSNNANIDSDNISSKLENINLNENSSSNDKHTEDSFNSNNNTKEKDTKEKQTLKNTSFDPNMYVIMMTIGYGNFSEILLVEHKETKKLFAMKMFTKMRVKQLHKEEDVLIEKHVMEKIPPHKNIIGYGGSFRDEAFLYVLYEYINGGELWKKCIYYGLPSIKLIKYYFVQILEAVQHMHSVGVIHRDIKVSTYLI